MTGGRARQANPEQDYRLGILNTLLRTPHRDVAPVIPVFREVHTRDPIFFGHLAAWYFDHGAVRDLKELFVAFMSTSDFTDEYRDAGLAMLETLPPYQVARVLQIIKGQKQGDKFVAGIVPSVPRSFRTAVEHYLRDRERDPQVFDSVVFHARKAVKTLYSSLRIKPGQYAQSILFDNAPPPGSKAFLLKKLAHMTDPSEQAQALVENKIPYRVAVSVLKGITPSLLVALVSAMSPQEVINNLSGLKKRGAMDNPDLRALIENKLEQAKSDKRVSALKTRKAIESANLDAEMSKRVEAVGDVQVKSKGRIKRPTALFVDKSGSMEQAIEVGKQVASIAAPICESDLYVYAFDTVAYRIKAKGNELSDWEKAFKGIKADGGTSCGVALAQMQRERQKVEQIVIVTDQEENNHPYFCVAYPEYCKAIGVTPSVVIVNVGRPSTYLVHQLKSLGIEADMFEFSGDYYSLPNLIPLLSGGTRLELLMEILEYPLPARQQRPAAVARNA